MAQSSSDDDILEGFLCPICKADLQSANQLTSHFKSRHQEDQDVLTSLKGIIGIAKKKIEESDLRETFDRSLKFNTNDISYFYEPQQIGLTRSKTDYYKAVRSAKLERYAAETNKLLIRLDKLVSNLPSEPNLRKLYEQEIVPCLDGSSVKLCPDGAKSFNFARRQHHCRLCGSILSRRIVPWLDGSSVKLCPDCAKSFNFARRQHHCRLCGSILCNDCSIFLDLNIAKQMTDPSWEVNKPANQVENPDKNGLRLCIHCYGLIELRKQMQDSRNSKTVLMTGYEQMRSLMDQARPSVAMYDKMCNSLYNGEATYHLSDLNSLRGRIGKLAEGIDLLSKQIAALPVRQPGSKEQKLQLSIRQAATHFIKEELLSLKRLPTEAEIADIRQKRLERAERQLELERRMQEERALEAALPSSSRFNDKVESSFNSSQHGEENPLLEQINIIRGYIKEARQEMRFEEVAILEANLKELKKEYQLQMLKTPT